MKGIVLRIAALFLQNPHSIQPVNGAADRFQRDTRYHTPYEYNICNPQPYQEALIDPHSERSTNSPMESDMFSNFFSLPREIRDQIYELVLLHQEPIDPWEDGNRRQNLNSKLLRANKTVHHETILLFYAQNSFDFTFGTSEDVASFLEQIGRNNADHICHICVDFPTFLLDTNSIIILANIQRGCASLSTLTMSLHSTSFMERRLDAIDKPQIVSEALHLSLASRAMNSSIVSIITLVLGSIAGIIHGIVLVFLKKLLWFADTAAKAQHQESLASLARQNHTQRATLSEIRRMRKAIDAILNKKSLWRTKRPKRTRSYNFDRSLFDVRFTFQGHSDRVRSVIFTGRSSSLGAEIVTSGDDEVVKRWFIPAVSNKYSACGPSPGIIHRGHTGAVLSLAASPASQHLPNDGRALSDGWVFSGGQDTTVRVWEKDKVDPKATLDGHTDAVWTVCVLSSFSASILGDQSLHHGGADRMLLASGALDGKILIWAVSTPPQLASSPIGSRRGAGVSSGSNSFSSPQPSTATSRPFHHSLVHQIERPKLPSPTCISQLSMSGDKFVVSFADASVIVYCTRTGKELIRMASLEAYNETPSTVVNAVAVTTIGLDSTLSFDPSRSVSGDKSVTYGATCSSSRFKSMVLGGYDDGYIRVFDAESGQYIYEKLAHFAAVSALSLSPEGRELVSVGNDASLRFWSLEKRSCTQEMINHSYMPGKGACTVIWSQDGRWVVSGGGDGIIKVLSR